jgi:multidrug efflux pump subunit AcrA (membrane-fusion protein)
LGVLGGIGIQNRTAIQQVDTVLLRPAPVEQTVTCKGRVEQGENAEVTVPIDCVVGEVLVKEGQSVQEGDPLFRVDKEATLSVLAQSESASLLQSVFSEEVPTTVTAPASGTVGELAVTPGKSVEKSTVCAVISKGGGKRIRISVPERSVRRVAVGQPVKISGIGFSKEEYTGEITEISGKAKQQMNGASVQTMVEAVVLLNKEQMDESLRVGLTASAEIIVSTVPQGFIIPYEAVAEDGENKEFVYILRSGTARKQVLTPVCELPDGYLVEKGFETGDVLILYPETVTEGAKCTAKEGGGEDV